MNKQLVEELGLEVKLGNYRWEEAANMYNSKTGENISGETLRCRYRRLKNKPQVQKNNETYETHNSDGSVELCKKVIFDAGTSKDPKAILEMFGYDDSWEIVSWTFGKWETAIKDEGIQEQCTFRAKIKPKVQELTPEENAEIVKRIVENIKPIKLPKTKSSKSIDKDKMIMLTIADLHLGRYCNKRDTGVDYNLDKAKSYFNYIIDELIKWQDMLQAGTLLYTIGNDFFNYDNVNGTTTKGTPLNSSCTYREMYEEGLNLQIQALYRIKELCHFTKIAVQMVQGNHDEILDYTMYLTLKKLFETDDTFEFNDDYKPIQKYEFGNNLIVQQHGDIDPKKLVSRMPVIFGKEWSNHDYRYFISNHKHSGKKEEDINSIQWIQQNTIIPTDSYEYKLGFIGEVQDQSMYAFDKDYGMEYTKIVKIKNK